MKKIPFFAIILLGSVLFLCSCTKYLPESEYLSYYEEHCKSEVRRGDFVFYAISLSADYERVKWGAPLDSGLRVLFGAVPRGDVTFENAFLVDGKDSSAVVLYRKAKTFELGAADSFVLSFADRKDRTTLFVSNVSNGIGGIEMKLKNCNNIRLIEK